MSQYVNPNAIKQPKVRDWSQPKYAKHVPVWFRFQSIIEGGSMLPTLLDGGTALLSYSRKFTRGDIVAMFIVKPGEKKIHSIIKRIIGLPGDMVHIDNLTGTVSVNGIALVEPYILGKTVCMTNYTKVPEDCVFVLGDNREGSYDSRQHGCIPMTHILSRAKSTTNYYGESTTLLRIYYDGLPQRWIKPKYDITSLQQQLKDMESGKNGTKKLHGETHKCTCGGSDCKH